MTTPTEIPTTDEMGRCSLHGSAMCTHPTADPALHFDPITQERWEVRSSAPKSAGFSHGYDGWSHFVTKAGTRIAVQQG